MRGTVLVACAVMGIVGLALRPAFADPRPTVVELFTSQGCSSCPPAEAFLGELAQRDDVLALAYHVDYWDNLGWPDPYSSPDATARQQTYADHLGLNYVYTPQMVIDGEKDVEGSDRDGVEAALKDKRDGVGIHLRRDAGDFVVDIAPQSGGKSAQVLLVAYDRTAETEVERGENAGRTLRQYNIVRGVYPLGEWDGTATELRFDLSKLPDSDNMVAVLLQEDDQGAILGAAVAPAEPVRTSSSVARVTR